MSSSFLAWPNSYLAPLLFNSVFIHLLCISPLHNLLAEFPQPVNQFAFMVNGHIRCS